TVEEIVSKINNSSYTDKFAYIPFNEPDAIWYDNQGELKERFFKHWDKVYEKIRSLDSKTPIAGPNISSFHLEFLRDFLEHGQKNGTLPDIMTWHELGDDFFANWEQNYEQYRAEEEKLGIAEIPIVINEYGRFGGDLTVPGMLIQWLARFEKSKVGAARAFWTAPGNLNDLVTGNSRPTGAWWVYRYYSQMAGNTREVSVPQPRGIDLQGIVTHDQDKNQVQVLLGGANGDQEIVFSNFNSVFKDIKQATLVVREIPYTGTNSAPRPEIIKKEEIDVSGKEVVLDLPDMMRSSAYYAVISPGSAAVSSRDKKHRYDAVYADISGSGSVKYDNQKGNKGVGYLELKSDSEGQFAVQAPDDGFYNLKVGYSGPSDVSGQEGPVINLNGEEVKKFSSAAGNESWQEESFALFLQAGINEISVAPGGQMEKINLDYLELEPGQGEVDVYEVDDKETELKGRARLEDRENASRGKVAVDIGFREENRLEFTGVEVPTDGVYRMVVSYTNAEMQTAHDYNTQVVERWARIRVNDGPGQKVYFRNTFAWDKFNTRVIDVELKAGKNVIEFLNQSYRAPEIDHIKIASKTSSAVGRREIEHTDSGIESGEVYKIINRNSGLALDVFESSTEEGANVIQWGYTRGGNQQWQLVEKEVDNYTLVNVNSNKLLEAGASSDNVNQHSLQEHENQYWQLEKVRDNCYQIVNVDSGKVLDVVNSSQDNGGNVVQNSDNGSYSQQWEIIKINKYRAH
ncbi:MAG: RICIN domain-containing protein, partial [Bacillota bacterium]